jgi:membrane-associated phospholipid phosphatase
MHPNCQKYRGFFLMAILVVLAAAALMVDIPVIQTIRRWYQIPQVARWLDRINSFEFFGHGFGVIFLLFVLHQLDRSRRWAIPRIAACCLAAGGLANLVKYCVVRERPLASPLDHGVLSTFGGWFQTRCADFQHQSFPSAHTAAAAAFASMLIWLYPQGRVLFTLLAVLVGCQRIICGAHFTSDVLAGGAIGVLAAQLFLHVGHLPGWFNRWEKSWRSN